jgi:hypothetical protein
VTETVRIPADVDRDDRLVAGLTARQLAILAVAGLVLAGLWAMTRALLSLPVFLIAAAPLGSMAVVLALGRRDGLPADRLALAALRHARTNRRLVPAPEGVPALPPGLPRAPVPGAMDLPLDDVGPDGTLHLGSAGRAVICTASCINFGLRSVAEQKALVAGLGRWLNSLSEPVQIVVRAERVDVAGAVAALRQRARSAPSIELEQAATDHACFLAELAARSDVLRRAVLVVFSDQDPDGGGLARRVADAASGLAAVGIALRPLAEPEARAVLAEAMNATASHRLGGPAEVVIGGWE